MTLLCSLTAWEAAKGIVVIIPALAVGIAIGVMILMALFHLIETVCDR